MLIPQTTPDEHPSTPPACRWSAFITLPTLAKFQLVGRCLCDVVLFRSACLFEHTLTSVFTLPEYQSCHIYIMCIQTFCEIPNIFYISDRTDLYRFEVRLELNGGNARLIVIPPSCLRLTPRRHRQADGQMSPLYPPRQVSARLAPLV